MSVVAASIAERSGFRTASGVPTVTITVRQSATVEASVLAVIRPSRVYRSNRSVMPSSSMGHSPVPTRSTTVVSTSTPRTS